MHTTRSPQQAIAGRQLEPGPATAITTRIAILPGRRPDWVPPHRLVGLIYRRLTRAFAGTAVTA
jgi:hypothetical protein